MNDNRTLRRLGTAIIFAAATGAATATATSLVHLALLWATSHL